MISLKVKNNSIDIKKNTEQEIQLEEIAKIVEDNIHIVDNELPVYDGYDVPEFEEDIHISETNRINENYDKSNENHNKSNGKKVVKSKNNKNDIKKRKVLDNSKKEVVYGEQLNRRYTTIEFIIGIAVISIICSSKIGGLGEMPKFLLFSKWNGITFGDLGLPLLLISICFMIPTEIEIDIKKKKSFREISIKKLKVGIILFFIGIVINLMEASNFNSFRIMGIFQMISIVYLFGSLLYILFRKFNFKISVIMVFLTTIGIVGLVGYYVASAKFGDSINTCLAYFIDSKVMPDHFGNFDRYGIMPTISAMFGGCLSISGGSFLCNKRVENRDKCNRILILGMFFVIIALLMEKNCPYNANVLSPSFMLIVLGGYCVIFSVLFVIFDLNRSKYSDIVSYPFVVMGASSLFVIGLNEFIRNTLFKINVYSIASGSSLRLDEWLVVDIFSEFFGNGTRMVGFLVIYILLIFVLMLYLYTKKIYIRFK